jgi:putative ABC transport system permease protein
VQWVLALCVPPDERDALTGDLAEAYNRHIRPALGPWRAGFWYSQQVLTACVYGLTARAGYAFANVRAEGIGRDLRYAIRGLIRATAFSLVVVLSLAVAIGANTSVFSLLYDVLLAPLPVPHPERLVSFQRVSVDGRDRAFSSAEYDVLRSTRAVASLTAIRSVDNVPVDIGGDRHYFGAEFVAGPYFDTIGLRPVVGRFITAGDEEARTTVAVVSERFSRERFGGDSAGLGQTLMIRGLPFSVVGVMPSAYRGLEYPGRFTMALPMTTAGLVGFPDCLRRATPSLDLVGRLRDGITIEAATAAADAIFERCCAAGAPGAPPGESRASHLALVGMTQGIGGGKDDFRDDVRGLLKALMAAVSLVLLITCAHVVNLFVIRGSSRAREIALRLSLGASRARVARTLLLEGVLLAAAGGSLGFALAAWARALLTSAIPTNLNSIADVAQFQVRPPVMGFTVAVCLASVLLTAVWPALRATSVDAVVAIRTGAQLAARGSGRFLQRVGVVVQVALALVLVSTASLLAATLYQLSRVDSGVRPDHVFLAAAETRGTSLELGGIVPVHQEILQRVRALPDVERAAMATYVPFFGGRQFEETISLETSPVFHDVLMVAITPDFLGTIGTSLTMGRDVVPTDGPTSAPVVVVSEALARVLGNDPDIVGRRVRLGGRDATATIVGVARDVKLNSLRSEAEPVVYVPATQSGSWPFFELVVRASKPLPGFERRLATTIITAAPGIQVRRESTLATEIDSSLARERFTGLLAALFGVIALGLAAMGIYGVVAYQVARRTSEFGVRAALGARGADLLWLVARGMLPSVAAGIALGIPLALLAARAIAPQLYGVEPVSPGLFTSSLAVLLVTAAFAVALPAQRAARVDPITSLRTL